MDEEETLRRMIEDNRQARNKASARLQRLVEAISAENEEKYHDAIRRVLDEYEAELREKGDDILGEDGEAESPDGS